MKKTKGPVRARRSLAVIFSAGKIKKSKSVDVPWQDDPNFFKNAPETFWLTRNLWDLRKKRGLTQEEVAKGAGVSLRGLQQIENSKESCNPSMNTMSALAKFFGTTVASLLKPSRKHEEIWV